MVLEFGLLKSGLFPESELSGVGLGADFQQAIINGAGVSWQFDRVVTATATENINITGLTKTHYLLVGSGDVNGVNDWELTVNGLSGAEYDYQQLRSDGATTASGSTANDTDGGVTNNIVAGGFHLWLEVFIDEVNSRIVFLGRFNQVSNIVLTGGRVTDTAATFISAIKIATGNALHTFDGKFYLYTVPTRE